MVYMGNARYKTQKPTKITETSFSWPSAPSSFPGDDQYDQDLVYFQI